jgi:MFS family permease
MFNGARLLGPSIGGVLIALVGEGGCFLIDGISYLAVIASLLAMTLRPAAPRPEPKHIVHELREGFRYAASSQPIRVMLMLLGVVSLVGMPFTVLMPLIATQRLGGGAHTLGFLMAAVGLGALGGAVRLALRRSVVGLGRTIVTSAIVFGLTLVAFAASQKIWLSWPLLIVVGFSMMLQTASTNTVLQTILEERMRGRVMAFYTMAVMGTAPFGSLIAGALADRIGAPWTIAGGGLVCASAAGYFTAQLPRLREQVRPIYQRLGILPEVAEGLSAAQDVSTPAA